MNAIDKGLITIALYVLFSAFFSLVYSMFSSSDKEETQVRPAEPEADARGAGKAKKEKVVKAGFVAFCNVCERTLENDTYLKNHLDGAKHKKKAKDFKGDVYTLRKA